MKKILLLPVALVISLSLFAQSRVEHFEAVDGFVKNLGALDSINVATIADTLTRKFQDKKQKARAIYYWIANNIALDPKATRGNDNKKADPVAVVQSRKATALGFANLVQEMCSMANIRCLVVDGFAKAFPEDINNKADEVNHSWNVVQLGQSPEEWYYIDAAKASGQLDKKQSTFTKQFSSGYFFADKSLFNLDHYPDNEAWQLGSGRKSLKEFYALPVIGRAAYDIGLKNPVPINGFIKTKLKTGVNFGFIYDDSKPITVITVVTGDGNKQSKPDTVTFSDNSGSVVFNYHFKKDDSYPVRILADGKEILSYYAEVED